VTITDDGDDPEVYLDYLEITPGERVLDIGAHRGGFTRLALQLEAQVVWAVEPEAENAAILRLRSPEARVIEAAVGAEAGWASLYLHERHVDHSIIRGDDTLSVVVVPMIGFEGLVLMTGPTFVKCDCEGAEFEFDWAQLPASVTKVAIELHRLPGQALHGIESVDYQLHLAGFARISILTLDEAAWIPGVSDAQVHAWSRA
jgi:FkbM family methyltransferase